MPVQQDHKDSAFILRRDGLVCLLLVIVIMIPYGQVRNYNFIDYDDDQYITENANVKEGLTLESIKWALTQTHAGNWHPLTWMSHMLDVQLFGMDAGRHHQTSLIFHILNSLLLFLVLKRMTRAFWPSLLTAALFALHPLNVESVAWVSERKNVLSTFFWILTMGAYALYVERRNAVRYSAVFLFLVLGLAAKPMLVTLPFVLLLLDYWPFARLKIEPTLLFTNKEKRITALRLIWEKLPLFTLTALSCAITFYAEKQGGTVGSLDLIPIKYRVLNALVSYTNYIIKLVWPANLSVLYPYTTMLPGWKIVGSCIVLLIISYMAIRMKHKPYIAVGWFWYLGTLVPVIGLVQIGSQAMADRYTYVPLIGIFVVLSWGISDLLTRWHQKRIWLFASAGIVLTILTAVTWKQIQYWENSILLFNHSIECTESNSILHCNLGVALENQGKRTEAIQHYSEALRIDPNYSIAHYNLGIALNEEGRINEAIEHYFKAIRTNSNYLKAHFNLGIMLNKQGRLDEAVEHYLKALQIKPDYAEAHFNLANTLNKQGITDKAVEHYLKALQIRPDYVEAYNNLGNTLEIQGHIKEAIQNYLKALQIKPDYEKAMINFNKASAKLKEIDADIEKLQQALRLSPNDFLPYFHLGDLYQLKGDLAIAENYYRKSLSLKPDATETMYHLAKLYINRSEYEKALTQYQNLLNYLPDNPAVYYNIACIYSRLNQPEQSVAWLKKAVASGFGDWNHINTDPDLDNIRNASEFRMFVKGR